MTSGYRIHFGWSARSPRTDMPMNFPEVAITEAGPYCRAMFDRLADASRTDKEKAA